MELRIITDNCSAQAIIRKLDDAFDCQRNENRIDRPVYENMALSAIPFSAAHKDAASRKKLRDAMLDEDCAAFGIFDDHALNPKEPLLVQFDADMTFYQAEVIDELGKRTPHAAQIEAITAEAMAGKIDFAESLRRRVAYLAGLEAGITEEIYQRLVFSPHIGDLITAVKKNGGRCGVVSGGFTHIIERLCRDFALDYGVANRLEEIDGKLTGQISGALSSELTKKNTLSAYAKTFGIRPENTVALGDGSNDRAVLEAAGTGIAYCAKPALRNAAYCVINAPDMRLAGALIGL